MDFLTYTLMLVISYSGIFIGLFLSHIAIEELTDVSTYLIYLDILLLMAIIFAVIYPLNISYAIASAILSGLILISVKYKLSKNNYDYEQISSKTFILTSALFYASTITGEAVIVSTLIFIYGISIGTSYFSKNIMNKQSHSKKILCIDFMNKVFIKHSAYLIIGLSIYGIALLIRNI
jgi:hypothetical protein